MGKGSKKQKTSSTSTYTPTYQGYDEVLGTANQVAQTPFNYDTTRNVAPFAPQQTQAFNQIAANQGAYAPYIDASTQYIGQGAQGTNAALQSYLNSAKGYAGQGAANTSNSLTPWLDQASQMNQAGSQAVYDQIGQSFLIFYWNFK